MKPVRDSSGRVISTNLFCALNTDAGGKIPQWVQTVAAPTVAQQSCNDLATALRSDKISNLNDLFKLVITESETYTKFMNAAERMKQHIQVNQKSIPEKVTNELFSLY